MLKAKRALVKLEQVLPSRLRQRVSALQIDTVPVAGGGPSVDADLLTAVATACRDHQQLQFGYRGDEAPSPFTNCPRSSSRNASHAAQPAAETRTVKRRTWTTRRSSGSCSRTSTTPSPRTATSC